MPVKVRLRVKSLATGKDIIVVAIVNTGFVSNRPELAVPTTIAHELGYSPSQEGALLTIIETGGGEAQVVTIPQAVKVKVVTRDRESREVVADLMINPYLEDVLISDALAEELGIQILYPKRGIWKFADEDKIRESETT